MFKLNLKIPHLSLGARGEKAALNYLKSIKYLILEINFCNKSGRRIGEIDIIAKEGNEIVFIEVKTRNNTSHNYVLPEENITSAKLYKLNKIASYYIANKKLYNSPYRFDAITILANSSQSTAKIKHLKNIFI